MASGPSSLHRVLLSAVTTGQATVGPAALDKITQLTAYATFASGVTAGVITIECAPSEDYAGTWSSLGTLTAGDDLADHLAITGPHLAIRARVSTTISGGGGPSATVTLVGTGG